MTWFAMRLMYASEPSRVCFQPVLGLSTRGGRADTDPKVLFPRRVVTKSETTPSIFWILAPGECQERVPEFAGETMKNVGSWHHLVRRKRICDYSMDEKKVVDILR